MIPAPARAQLGELVAGTARILGAKLRGLYLHGSAVLGALGPWSDLDVLGVLSVPTSVEEKRDLGALCVRLSAPYGRPRPPYPLELDLVVDSELRLWRHPAPFDFHYGESWRERFEAQEPQPWSRKTNADLAAHLTVVQHSGQTLFGPPPGETLPVPPWEDYRAALRYDAESCREPGFNNPRYAALSLARIWATLASKEVHSKPRGAEWALARLPEELAPALRHALRISAGEADEGGWDELPVAAYVEHVGEQIDRLS